MLVRDNTSRQLKVATLIQRCLMKILQRGKQLDNKLLDNKVTFTKVKVSPDLKIVSCYFLPFGKNEVTDDELLAALNTSRNVIRYQLTQEINLKFSPELRFFYDHSYRNISDVAAALSQLG